MSEITVQEAKEGLESIGMWMDARYNSRFVGTPIQTWDMPRKEKEFFTVYAMNLMLESDGFDSLVGQEPQDVEAFIDLLRRLGAKKTSAYVQSILAALRSKTPCDVYGCTNKYYDLFESEEVWLKLLDHLGRRIYVSYVLRAQAIEEERLRAHSTQNNGRENYLTSGGGRYGSDRAALPKLQSRLEMASDGCWRVLNRLSRFSGFRPSGQAVEIAFIPATSTPG